MRLRGARPSGVLSAFDNSSLPTKQPRISTLLPKANQQANETTSNAAFFFFVCVRDVVQNLPFQSLQTFKKLCFVFHSCLRLRHIPTGRRHFECSSLLLRQETFPPPCKDTDPIHCFNGTLAKALFGQKIVRCGEGTQHFPRCESERRFLVQTSFFSSLSPTRTFGVSSSLIHQLLVYNEAGPPIRISGETERKRVERVWYVSIQSECQDVEGTTREKRER